MLNQIPSCNILRIAKKLYALAAGILVCQAVRLIQGAVQKTVLLPQIGKLQTVFPDLHLFTQKIHAMVNAVKIHVDVLRPGASRHSCLKSHIIRQLIADIGAVKNIAQKNPGIRSSHPQKILGTFQVDLIRLFFKHKGMVAPAGNILKLILEQHAPVRPYQLCACAFLIGLICVQLLHASCLCIHIQGRQRGGF